MALFAALDDSLYRKGNFYVYAHALVTPDDVFALVIQGDKDQIYSKEDSILEFIINTLPEGSNLIACPHYMIYPSIKKLVYCHFNDRQMPRDAKKIIRWAHEAAKSAAKQAFEDSMVKANFY